MKNIKVGDWLLYEFGVCQVKKIWESGNLTVSDGTIESGSVNPDTCMPLTLRNKQISDWFEWHYQRLHREARNLNWPDVHRWFVAKWLEACVDENNTIKCQDEVREFVEEVISKYNKITDSKICGVRVFPQ